MVVRFAIGLDGGVASAELAEGTIEDDRVRQDVLDVFRRLSFPARSCGDELVVTYPLTLQPAPRQGEQERVRERRSTVVVSGALAAEVVRDTLRGSETSLRDGYAAVLLAQPDLGGRLVVRFNLTEGGEVYALNVTDPDGTDARAPLIQLVRAAVAPLRFPAAGSDTTVVFPLLFEPPEERSEARVITP